MISRRDLALVERARRFFAGREESEMLARFPAEADVARLGRAAFDELMDLCTANMFRDRARPILSEARRVLLEDARRICGITPFAWRTSLRSCGADDARDLDGLGFLRLVAMLEAHDPRVPEWAAGLRAVSDKQVRLIQTARRKLALPEAPFRRMVQGLGAVNSTSDLDERGFDLVMALLTLNGFAREPAVVPDESLGRRPGFATPEQLGLIRALWREWSGADDEAALAAWLERSHGVSALRFMTGAAAGKAITALKAMKRRRGARRGDTAA